MSNRLLNSATMGSFPHSWDRLNEVLRDQDMRTALTIHAEYKPLMDAVERLRKAHTKSCNHAGSLLDRYVPTGWQDDKLNMAEFRQALHALTQLREAKDAKPN